MLASGPLSATGLTIASDGEHWTDTSSTWHGPDEPLAVVELLAGPADGPDREVRCAVAFRAPDDRGLLVEGELRVSLRTAAADGAQLVELLDRVAIDRQLEAGERVELDPTRGVTVWVSDVRSVHCVAELR